MNPAPYLSKQISDVMMAAVMVEAVVWPSPGLVNALDSGSHQDMDVTTFLRSAVAIEPYFRLAAMTGMEHPQAKPVQDLFPLLKQTGIRAERAMLRATNGVNTHKGTIFLGLLLCAAAGVCCRRKSLLAPSEVCSTAKQIAVDRMKEDLDGSGEWRRAVMTTGMRAYLELGLPGIRGEVLDGFSNLLNFGLPALKAALGVGMSLRESVAHSLLVLISQVEDTTILNRTFDPARIKFAQAWAQSAIGAGSVFTPEGRERIQAMHHDFISRSISPGGSADLVSMTMALYWWEKGYG